MHVCNKSLQANPNDFRTLKIFKQFLNTVDLTKYLNRPMYYCSITVQAITVRTPALLLPVCGSYAIGDYDDLTTFRPNSLNVMLYLM